jgi:hypothetical protein
MKIWMGNRGYACLVALALALIACSNAANLEKTSRQGHAWSTPPTPTKFNVNLVLPSGTTIVNAAVGAAGSLKIGQGDHVLGALLSGDGRVDLEEQSSATSVTTSADVDVDPGATVSGNIVAGGKIVAPPPAVVGGIQTPFSGTTPVTTGWTVSVPVPSQGPITLNAQDSAEPAPATYDAVELHSGSTMYLRTGTYYFQSLDMHSGADLVVDSRQGPVVLYVLSTIAFRGVEKSIEQDIPRLILEYLGTADAILTAPFEGIFLAPNAGLHLDNATPSQPIVNDGTFYGLSFSADPGEVINATRFDWSQVPGFPPPSGGWAALTNNLPPSGPLTVVTRPQPALSFHVRVDGGGAGANTATAQATSQVPLTLPDQFEVAGEIANGSATISCVPSSGATAFTCNYQGQASSATPTTILDLEAGRLLKFVSCSDGQPAGIRRMATTCSLSVTPAPGWPVVVDLSLDDRACTGDFEVLTGYQTRLLHDSFNWASAPKACGNPRVAGCVDEVNPDGTPTLYYAWVYVHNDKDLLALHQMFVHILPRPLFTHELAPFAGKCGAFRNPGDGTGVMIPVLIPGTSYKALTDVLTEPGITGNRVLFDAVILRNSDVPPDARNPNGSVKLSTLAAAHFQYLSYDQPLPAQQSDIKLTGGVVVAAVNALEAVLTATKAVGHFITDAIGAIDVLASGKVTFDITLGALYVGNTTPSFDPNAPMVRAWGTKAGSQLGAGGLEVQLMQFLDGVIPETFGGTTDDDGHVVIQPASHSSAAVGGKGICVGLNNSALRLNDFLESDDLCSFSDIEFDNTGGLPTAFTSELPDFDQDRTVRVNTSDERLSIMFQATDAYLYSQHIMNYTPSQAHVLVGPFADIVGTFNTGRAFTACLHFDQAALADLSNLLATGGFISSLAFPELALPGTLAAVTTAIMGNNDIFIPLSAVPGEREIASHEYGHFLLCNLVNDVDPNGVSQIIFGSIAAGLPLTGTGGNDYTYPIRYINEAWADFISGQVTGIANYNWVSQPGPRNQAVCALGTPIAGPPLPCFDANFDTLIPQDNVASNNSNPQNIARISSMIHDAFDGQNAKSQIIIPPMNGNPEGVINVPLDRPNDADPWTVDTTSSNPGYVYTGIPWGDSDRTFPNGDKLETVALPGSSITDFVHLLAIYNGITFTVGPFGTGVYLSDASVIKALDTEMIASGVTSWCQRCPVFALHSTTLESNASLPPAGVSLRALLKLCNGGDSLIHGVMGDAPFDPATTPLDVNTCKPCPSNETSDDDLNCQAPCQGTIVNNVCTQCTADKVINGMTDPFDPLPLGIQGVTPGGIDSETTTPGDNCPGQFWLQIDHPQAYFGRGAIVLTSSLTTLSQTDCQGAQSLFSAQQTAPGNPFTDALTRTAAGVFNPGSSGPPLSIPPSCTGLPSITIGSLSDLPGAGTADASIRFGVNARSGLFLDFHASVPTIGH